MGKEYVQGYYEALDELDQRVTESIKRNGGAKTAVQTLRVFNDMLTLMHQMKGYAHSTVRELDEVEQQPQYTAFIKGGLSL